MIIIKYEPPFNFEIFVTILRTTCGKVCIVNYGCNLIVLCHCIVKNIFTRYLKRPLFSSMYLRFTGFILKKIFFVCFQFQWFFQVTLFWCGKDLRYYLNNFSYVNMIFSLVVKHGNTLGVAEFRCLSFKGPSSTITPLKFYKQRSHQKTCLL